MTYDTAREPRDLDTTRAERGELLSRLEQLAHDFAHGVLDMAAFQRAAAISRERLSELEQPLVDLEQKTS